MSLKREGNVMEDEKPCPPSFSIFRVIYASALELIDRESYASVCKGTRWLANLGGYPFHLANTYRQ